MPEVAAVAGRIWPSLAGAKTAPATIGARSATSATWRAASSGQPRISPHSSEADHYEAIFSEGRAEFRRRDFDFETHTEIVVSPEDDIELRRVHITNRSRAPRDDRRHELRGGGARAGGRRRIAPGVQQSVRANRDHPGTARNSLHPPPTLRRRTGAVDVSSDDRARQRTAPEISFETDRMRFIGRGRSVVAPRAMTDHGPLSNTEGSVLDPIAAIRHRMTIARRGHGDDRHGVGRRRDARCRTAISSTNTRIVVSRIVCSN